MTRPLIVVMMEVVLAANPGPSAAKPEQGRQSPAQPAKALKKGDRAKSAIPAGLLNDELPDFGR